MKDLYECHITCLKTDAKQIENISVVLGWKFSQIDGDPVLGKETFCYLTTHDNEFRRMYSRMEQASALVKSAGIKVIREKIELIIHDTKRIAQN